MALDHVRDSSGGYGWNDDGWRQLAGDDFNWKGFYDRHPQYVWILIVNGICHLDWFDIPTLSLV